MALCSTVRQDLDARWSVYLRKAKEKPRGQDKHDEGAKIHRPVTIMQSLIHMSRTNIRKKKIACYISQAVYYAEPKYLA